MKTEIKRPSVAGLDRAFTIIAFASLKENNEPLDNENIDAEAARIERCVEYYYKIDKNAELNYPEFASKFLQDNYKEIVFGTKYLGFFTEDLPEGKERNFYMDEATVLI
jgi:hypothetical protein